MGAEWRDKGNVGYCRMNGWRLRVVAPGTASRQHPHLEGVSAGIFSGSVGVIETKNDAQKMRADRSSQIATVWPDCEISTDVCQLRDQGCAFKCENNGGRMPRKVQGIVGQLKDIYADCECVQSSR